MAISFKFTDSTTVDDFRQAINSFVKTQQRQESHLDMAIKHAARVLVCRHETAFLAIMFETLDGATLAKVKKYASIACACPVASIDSRNVKRWANSKPCLFSYSKKEGVKLSDCVGNSDYVETFKQLEKAGTWNLIKFQVAEKKATGISVADVEKLIADIQENWIGDTAVKEKLIAAMTTAIK